MTKVLPLSQWKKDPPSERQAFSDEDSDEENSEYEEILIPKKKDVKRKRGANEVANSKRIKPNPKPQIRIPKKSVRPAMPNNQAPKKTVSGIDGAARTAFWPTSKAIQTESIQALILPFSKIIREGPTVYYCDHVTNVTYKIQCKYPDISFLRRLVENQN